MQVAHGAALVQPIQDSGTGVASITTPETGKAENFHFAFRRSHNFRGRNFPQNRLSPAAGRGSALTAVNRTTHFGGIAASACLHDIFITGNPLALNPGGVSRLRPASMGILHCYHHSAPLFRHLSANGCKPLYLTTPSPPALSESATSTFLALRKRTLPPITPLTFSHHFDPRL